MPSAVVELLFLVALTAVIGRSYLRYYQAPHPNNTLTGSLTRPVILIVGGFVCLSLVLATLSKLAEVLR